MLGSTGAPWTEKFFVRRLSANLTTLMRRGRDWRAGGGPAAVARICSRLAVHAGGFCAPPPACKTRTTKIVTRCRTGAILARLGLFFVTLTGPFIPAGTPMRLYSVILLVMAAALSAGVSDASAQQATRLAASAV